jgi:hypothetical protein
MGDRQSLYAAAFVRSVSTGMMGVLLGVYRAELKLDATTIGVFIGVGLSGAALATLVVTAAADRVGMGRDRGAALVLEQAVLPTTTTDRECTNAFARYNVLQDIGHALGALPAGVPALFQHWSSATENSALQASVGIYAVLCILPCVIYLRLSARIEVSRLGPVQRVSNETKRVLWKISSLFALDSVGGGFLTTALLSSFFRERFGASIGAIAAVPHLGPRLIVHQLRGRSRLRGKGHLEHGMTERMVNQVS